MSARSREYGRETITPGGESRHVLANIGAVLDSPAVDPEIAGIAVSQLESETYDLALAVIHWEDTNGDARAVQRVRACLREIRASLREIEERLLWVQRNRFDADGRRTREELLAAHDCTRAIFTRLGEEGIVLEAVDSQSGRNFVYREP